MMLLKARGVSVRLGGRLILDKVKFGIAERKLVGLIGPNGAGKTTLLRVLANLQTIESGDVRFGGKPIAAIDRRTRARKMAFIAQGAPCHWPLTVDRLVALGRLPHLTPWQRPGNETADAIHRAMCAADVAQLASRTVTSLSAGERTRAMIARALAGDPKVLLADEPIATLDPVHQLRVMDLLRDRTRAGGAVVVVLHDLSLAARYCDRLALMKAGKIVLDAPPPEILTPDILARAYDINAVFGQKDGELFVVPWEALPQPTGEPPD